VLPADCHEVLPLFDQAAWPVPADGPDGTNYAVDAAAGTVLDRTTNLMWLATTSPVASFEDAKCACRAVSAGGFLDWRMPSLLELVTIVDYAKNIDPSGTGTTVAATNTSVFPDTRLAAYWTATPQAKGSSSAGMPYLLDFTDGGTLFSTDPTGKGNFRCVRAAGARPTSPRYVARTDTVLDGYTSLEWQRFVSNVMLKPDEATGYCTQLDLAGHHDWKLPTVKELASLVDVSHYPMLDPNAFGASTTTLHEFVTGTRFGANPTASAWYVDFDDANIGLRDPSTQADYVRCVRHP
jgi:hypothetical protein